MMSEVDAILDCSEDLSNTVDNGCHKTHIHFPAVDFIQS